MKTVRLSCDQCEMLAINGIACHETGCPDAWQSHPRECKWCGSEFMPEDRRQAFCGPQCAASYNDEL